MNQPNIATYAPDTVLTVGTHRAKILKYLTSGGFAQVYKAEISPADTHSGSNIACLKRVVVPDKASLNTPRAEVDAMKLLRNNNHVVSYIDSHAEKSPMNNGSYEVFLLMEYCVGGGLIDFMNTRLQNRLTEAEVLNIMSQVSQGVAAMHALEPPLLHRDIKIENVLISNRGEYKLCDFGSVCGVIRPPTTQQEVNFVQHDILTNTTAQYRSPEMIDMYRNVAVDEKSDIWALGVFLYKVCYYTTPFEKEGEQGILHSRFQYPAYPQYSDKVKNLIRVMLMQSPDARPNICQVLEEVSRIQGVTCPLPNFYLERAIKQSQSQLNPHSQMTSQMFMQMKNQPQMVQPIQHSMSFPSMQAMSSQYHTMDKISVGNNVRTDSSFMVAQPIKMAPNPTTQLNGNNLPSRDMNARTPQPVPNVQSSELKLERVRTMPEHNSDTMNKVQGGRGNISSIVNSNPTKFDKQAMGTKVLPVIAPHNRDSSKSSINSVDSYKSTNLVDKVDSNATVNLRNSKSLDTNGSQNDKAASYNSLAKERQLKHRSLPAQYDDSKSSPIIANSPMTGKDSIKNRVRNLMENADATDVVSSASGYGRFTEAKREIEIAPTSSNNNILTGIKTNKSNEIKNKPKSAKPAPPVKPAHLRPKKPPKPTHLLGTKKATTNVDETNSKTNEAYETDLERDFKKRFPSIS